MNKIESWVEESQRRNETVRVVLENARTGERVLTSINPAFIAQITDKAQFVSLEE